MIHWLLSSGWSKWVVASPCCLFIEFQTLLMMLIQAHAFHGFFWWCFLSGKRKTKCHNNLMPFSPYRFWIAEYGNISWGIFTTPGLICNEIILCWMSEHEPADDHTSFIWRILNLLHTKTSVICQPVRKYKAKGRLKWTPIANFWKRRSRK